MQPFTPTRRYLLSTRPLIPPNLSFSLGDGCNSRARWGSLVLSSSSYKRALGFEATRDAWRRISRSPLPRRDCCPTLSFSPRPLFIAEVPPTGVPLLPRSSHLGASVFLLRCAAETPRKRASVAEPWAGKVMRSSATGSNRETILSGSTASCREEERFTQHIVFYPQRRHCIQCVGDPDRHR
jgi:hypothetical protein